MRKSHALAVGSILSCFEATLAIALARRAIPSNYESVGCLKNDDEQILVTFGGLSATGMTLARCAIACSTFLYFGVVGGNLCWCGDTTASGNTEGGPSDCNLPCSGNDRYGTDDVCGGSPHMNVYRKLDVDAGTDYPPPKPFNSIGCYAEGNSQAILSDSTFTYPGSTVFDCQVLCSGYRYFGLRNAFFCVCGDTINSNTRIADDSSCTARCSGDSQPCGSDNSLFQNIYASEDLAACGDLDTSLRVRNPGFEHGVAYWSEVEPQPDLITWRSVAYSQGNTGVRAARITSRLSEAKLTLTQTIRVCPGIGYILSYWARKPPSGASCTAGANFAGRDDVTLSVSEDGSEQKFYVSSIFESAWLNVWGSCSFSGSSATMYLDNIELRPATAADSPLFPPLSGGGGGD